MNRPGGIFKRKPQLPAELQGRFAKLSKADWADAYSDLHRQVFGEISSPETVLSDAERRIGTLKGTAPAPVPPNNGTTNHRAEGGYVDQRPNRNAPGTSVVLYVAAEQGIDAWGNRYAIVCDAHGQIGSAKRLPGADLLMKHPEEFCSECQEIAQCAERAAWARDWKTLTRNR